MTSGSSKGRSSREEEEVDDIGVESVKTSTCGLRGFVAGKRVVSEQKNGTITVEFTLKAQGYDTELRLVMRLNRNVKYLPKF